MIKIAIIGTGGMAHAQATQLQNIKGCRVTAACDVDKARVAAFASKFGIPQSFTSPEKLLKTADIDAVSNITPDAMHLPISLKVIAAGRHVLCEKPLALNAPDANRMAAAAKKRGVINMVHFSYRSSAAVQKAHALIASGKLGAVVHFEASYLQSWLSSKIWGDWKTNPAWLWRLSTKHGSKGVLGDVGVHIIDMATFIAGDVATVNCKLKAFTKLKGKRMGAYPLDANDSAVMHCELKNGALGVIHTTRWATGHANSLKMRVHCERGAIAIDLDRDYSTLEICSGDAIDKGKWTTLECPPTPSILARFVKSVRTGKNDMPDFARGAAVQRMLDACFESDASGKTVRV
jgi:predicted dehydrogenase